MHELARVKMVIKIDEWRIYQQCLPPQTLSPVDSGNFPSVN